MNPKEIMHRWSGYLQSLLPSTHLYQVLALAAFSFAAARARHCHLSRLAAEAPLPALPGSTLRRLKRLINNQQLDVEAVCRQMAAYLRAWNQPGTRLILLMDETPHGNRWRVLKMSVCYPKRALPLVWRTDELSGRSVLKRTEEVLQQTAEIVQQYAPAAQVVLLADRGFCWPSIIDFCTKQGWHYVLRAQHQTRFRWQDDQGVEQRCSLGDLAPQPGSYWKGSGRAFAKAGWRGVSAVACWRSGSKEAWLLVSNLPPSLHLVRWYARRMWHEQSFRDEKSHGFNWQDSRVKEASRVHRLLLILALAQLWLMSLGSCVLQSPQVKKWSLTCGQERKRLSVFQAAWQYLLRCLHVGVLPPCDLRFLTP
jgi:hypothetical protein